jgi:two-component system CheB/CheR fusion protein
VTPWPPPKPYPVVGIGASAGGLEAFSELLHALPRDPGLAIILVPHLASQVESALPSLLGSRTTLPVMQATEGAPIEKNRVYVIPPNTQMRMVDGTLHLLPRPHDRTQYTPIDIFLHSLAESARENAIAVILSGTASDGTIGIREVKAAGGIVLAQRPETAKYDGMPRAAIATNVVDAILDPKEIATELVRIAEHPFRDLVRSVEKKAENDVEPGSDEAAFQRVLHVLRTATGVDFTRYKRPTVERRLHRRMLLQKFTRVEQYLKFLQESPTETHALYQDILIHVTRFFREPQSFEMLTRDVFPGIVADRQRDNPIRVWTPGCSTGEEAYSVAVTLLEYLGDHGRTIPLQLFATDVSEPAIEHARAGVYPESIAADVSATRLRRFFTKIERGYRVNKTIRDLCVFARQDLTRDPPFSKLDLIVCRNVLIYMGAELQKKLITVFHYALKPAGYLVLGSAETIGIHADLFSVTDKKFRVYQKKLVSTPVMTFPVEHAAPVAIADRKAAPVRGDDTRAVLNEASRLVQDRYAPPGVVVDQDLHVVQFRGQTGAFFEPAAGDPSHNVLKMAREGLLHGLRSTVQEARRGWKAVRRDGLRVRTNGGWHDVNLHVLPLGAQDRPHFLILLEADGLRRSGARAARGRGRGAKRGKLLAGRHREGSAHAARLEDELASTRDHLQSIIQELEAANEELQSANEEILSANEELQSTNEELDTAKEELQSTNEELNTVNEELHARNEELTRVNSDLVNLLGSVQIAIVIVASDLRIRRFTPMAERVLNLIATDVGRPIGHIKPNIECDDLEDLVHQVIEHVTPIEREVRDRQGNRYFLRVRAYKNVENRIEGAVLALFDIEPILGAGEQLAAARAWTDAILEAAHEPLLVVDDEGRVRGVNAAFVTRFGISPDSAAGRPVAELPAESWPGRAVAKLVRDLAKAPDGVSAVGIGGDGHARLVVNGRRIPGHAGEGAQVVLAFREPPPARGS